MSGLSDVKFGSWEVAECPTRIEYSLVVIEEIRHEVAEGFQKISRGGIEVGGVLYGTREGNTTRILAIRPMACEHARGPSFLLSERDQVSLLEQLRQDRDDPRLEGFECMGWFLSHTRTEIELNESDQELYSSYFPEPWQVALVVRPGRGGAMRAGFFAREPDGRVNAARSYLEFAFPDRLAAVFDREPRVERPIRERSAGILGLGLDRNETSSVAPRREQSRVQPLPSAAALEPPPEPKKKWLWLVLWGVVVVAVLIFAVRYYLVPSIAEPIGLSVLEREGQLQIEWNHAARPVVRAARGILEITDGAQPPTTIPLTPANLAEGKFTYQRNSGDVEVLLSVERPDGSKTQEASRFLGQPKGAADGADAKAADSQRASAEAEVERLRAVNAEQTDRIQQLERTLRILQTRLGAGAK